MGGAWWTVGHDVRLLCLVRGMAGTAGAVPARIHPGPHLPAGGS